MLTSQTQSSSGPASHWTGEESEAQRREVTWQWARLLMAGARLGPVSRVFCLCLPLDWASPFWFLFSVVFTPPVCLFPLNLSVGLTEEQVMAIAGRGVRFSVDELGLLAASHCPVPCPSLPRPGWEEEACGVLLTLSTGSPPQTPSSIFSLWVCAAGPSPRHALPSWCLVG